MSQYIWKLRKILYIIYNGNEKKVIIYSIHKTSFVHHTLSPLHPPLSLSLSLSFSLSLFLSLSLSLILSTSSK